MTRRYFQLIILSLISYTSIGQVVTSVPAFPEETDSITIIFDASEGDRGLMDYAGDIWAHTGVLTNLSQNPSDWRHVLAPWSSNQDKAKLVFTGDNKWELKIEPSIREYYDLPENEHVTHLAFVFRNNDGSQTGRGENGADILFELAALDLRVIQPDSDWFMAAEGDRITVEALAPAADSMLVFHDDDLIYGVAGEDLYFEFEAQAGGKHDVVIVAKNSSSSTSDFFSYAVRETFDLPEGVIDGINYIDDTTVVLVLYAPAKDSVNVRGDFNDWTPGPGNLMKNTPDGNRFWLRIENLEPKKEYRFQYLVDGHLQIADPYTEKTSDYNDQFINEETYPDLLMFPSNETIHAASILQTAQEEYVWEIEEFERPDQSNLVIYELLVRDFTADHTFASLIDTLDYIENLGITAVELMPPSEFEGNVSWGYNPSFYFAPDKYYGPKDTFKAFIDECHKRGIAVIMDIVLNHAYGRCPLVRLYWDENENRPATNSPWFNTVSPNPVFSWGYDFNHESAQTKAFVDSVNRFWLEKYNIDGFRFDFTKGFTNTPGDGSSYDQSRIDILMRMADKIWEVEEDAYIILEHFAPTEEEVILTDYGMMVWANVNYAGRKAGGGNIAGSSTDLEWLYHAKRGLKKPHQVGYLESHDEERLMYDIIEVGKTNNPNYNVQSLDIALKRSELLANFFIPVPGPKMIWMFGELGYDYSIDYNGRVGRKPIKWEYFEDPDRKRLYKVYSALNSLKRDHQVFKTDRIELSLRDTVRRIRLVDDEDMHVSILGNFGIWPSQGSPKFTHEGWWYEFWSGDSLYVEDKEMIMSLEPGEYRFYSDVKLINPYLTTGINEIGMDIPGNFEFKVYPNPVEDKLFVHSNSIPGGEVKISIIDIRGRILSFKIIPHWEQGHIELINSSNLRRGIFFVKLESENGIGFQKLIK